MLLVKLTAIKVDRTLLRSKHESSPKRARDITARTHYLLMHRIVAIGNGFFAEYGQAWLEDKISSQALLGRSTSAPYLGTSRLKIAFLRGTIDTSSSFTAPNLPPTFANLAILLAIGGLLARSCVYFDSKVQTRKCAR